MFGFEEYIYSLIEEAKSPEEIKKILNYQFVQGKGVPERVLDEIFDIDPTKKKSYTRWVLMQWDKYKRDILDAIDNGRLKRMFDTFKERERDGLNLAGMESFEKAMEYIPDVDPILEKEGDPNSPENDFDILYKSSEWIVAEPHTYEANKKLGQGCRWCTAGAFGDNDYYWNRYSPAGPIFVNFDLRHHEISPTNGKEYPYTRYQFLFEWGNWSGELMDSDDHRVDFEKMEMPEEVIEFYGEQNPRYKKAIESNTAGEDAWNEYLQERQEEYLINVLNVDDNRYLSLMPEQNQQMDFDVDYMLYDEEEDMSDPVVSATFNKDDFLVARSPDNRAAVLKTTAGTLLLAYWDEDRGRRYSSGSWEYEYLSDYWSVGYFFIAMHRSYMFVFPMDDEYSEYSIVKFDADEAFNYGGNIDKIVINKNITEVAMENGIEGYHGIVFEVIFGDGEHGMFMYDGAECIPMIRQDKPVGADLFQATFDGGKICIHGEHFTHKFGEYGESDEGNLSIDDDLGEVNGHKYYLVQQGSEYKYNIYDANERRLLFEYPYARVLVKVYDDQVFAICKNEGIDAIYSINNQKYIAKDCDAVGILFQLNSILVNKYLWAKEQGGLLHVYSVPLNFKAIGDFLTIRKELTGNENHAFVVAELTNGFLNVVDLETGKIMLPNDKFVNWGPMTNSGYHGNSSPKLVMLATQEQLKNRVCSIYNFITGESVCDDYDINFKYPKQIFENAYKIKRGDGKYNLINGDGNILLPKNVDFMGDSYVSAKPKFLVIADGLKMWFIDNEMNLYPTKNGIDLSQVQSVGVDFAGRPMFKYKGCDFYLTLENGHPQLYFTNGYSEQMEREIESIIFSEKAQIRENFRKVFGMINNFYNDKD